MLRSAAMKACQPLTYGTKWTTRTVGPSSSNLLTFINTPESRAVTFCLRLTEIDTLVLHKKALLSERNSSFVSRQLFVWTKLVSLSISCRHLFNMARCQWFGCFAAVEPLTINFWRAKLSLLSQGSTSGPCDAVSPNMHMDLKYYFSIPNFLFKILQHFHHTGIQLPNAAGLSGSKILTHSCKKIPASLVALWADSSPLVMLGFSCTRSWGFFTPRRLRRRGVLYFSF